MSLRHRERTVHERSFGVVRRKVPVEQAVLHVVFPLEAYWRRVSYIGEDGVNHEGLIYPSFSDIVFPANYKIEMTDRTARDTFLIHYANGFAPCPICGRGISAHLENYKVKIARGIKAFTHEAAYEIVAMALSQELAKRMKAHIGARHKYFFKRLGRERIQIVRYVGAGQVVVVDSMITTYACPRDGAKKLYGVYGVLDHLVSLHENTDITSKILQQINDIQRTAKLVLGLPREQVPILGAYRNTFTYPLVNRKSDLKPRLLLYRRIRQWLSMRIIEHRDGVDLVLTASIPRPVRMIYHYPIFRYIPHVIAYKLDPDKYTSFMEDSINVLKRHGYGVERLEALYELVTGTLAYTSIEPKHAYNISLDLLADTRKAIDALGKRLSIFLGRKVVG